MQHTNRNVKAALLLLLLIIASDELAAQDARSFLNRILSLEETELNKSHQRLASGTRLLPDDPANHVIYEKLRAHINSLEGQISNQNDLISYYRTVDGFLSEIIESLQRIRELVLNRSSFLYSGESGEYVDLETEQFYDHILYTLRNAEFNKLRIFEEFLSDGLIKNRFQSKSYYKLDNVDRLLSVFIAQRTTAGTTIRALESRIRSSRVEAENLAGFQSTIWDVDIGEERQRLKRHHLLFIVNMLLL